MVLDVQVHLAVVVEKSLHPFALEETAVKVMPCNRFVGRGFNSRQVHQDSTEGVESLNGAPPVAPA
jgi:hypothetical protein